MATSSNTAPSVVLRSTISAPAALTRFLWNSVIIAGDGQGDSTPPQLAFSAFTGDRVVMQDQFRVDPSNPFFQFFAGGPPIILSGTNVLDNSAVTMGAAFRSDFSMTNGGIHVGEVSVYWGDGNSLDGANQIVGGNPWSSSVNSTPPPLVQTLQLSPLLAYGPSIIAANDPQSQSCPFAVPGSTASGFIGQWSGLADAVTVTTSILATGWYNAFTLPYGGGTSDTLNSDFAVIVGDNFNFARAGGTFYHGLCQQPWGGS